MFNMGIGGSDHDISVCIAENDVIKIAIDEERVTRFKYGIGSNYMEGASRKYCLDALGISMEDMKHIVGTDMLIPNVYFPFREKIKLINHHIAHAASAFFPSPFEKAAVLVIDNCGSMLEWNGVRGVETLSYYVGDGNKLDCFNKVIGGNWNSINGDPDNSLGYFYKIISHMVGFTYITNSTGKYKDLYFTEDGKTMGLASYGEDTYCEVFEKYFSYEPNGIFKIELTSGKMIDEIETILNNAQNSFKAKADIAYAAQYWLEKTISFCLDYLYEKTGLDNLCIAGGVGLNSVANGRCFMRSKFKNIFIQPAAGDNGTAIGCALYSYYVLEKQNRDVIVPMTNAFLGKEYSEDEYEQGLKLLEDQGKYSIQYCEDVTKETVQRLVAQKIIGWYQGRSEYGPRALGHRSIIVDPRLDNMKDILNSRVKKREGFRPFAPAILEQYKDLYFDLSCSKSPYMLLVCNVKKEKAAEIPAVVHVDQTARIQTVAQDENPQFYELIKEFYNETGTPVLLNTSFNIKGEPIVESPTDAVRCFTNTDIDCLILGNYIIDKIK